VPEIRIAPAARRELTRQQAARERPGALLRIDVRAGGCSGWYYALDFVDAPGPGDCYLTGGAIAAVADARQASILDGLLLDYSEDLMGGSFRFQNPHASSTCSCGVSFAIASESALAPSELSAP